jgi:hypothetical protein
MESLGTAYAPTLKRLNSSSFKTDLFYSHKDWTFSTSIAADTGSLLGDRWGIGLSVKKQGITSLFSKD